MGSPPTQHSRTHGHGWAQAPTITFTRLILFSLLYKFQCPQRSRGRHQFQRIRITDPFILLSILGSMRGRFVGNPISMIPEGSKGEKPRPCGLNSPNNPPRGTLVIRLSHRAASGQRDFKSPPKPFCHHMRSLKPRARARPRGYPGKERGLHPRTS